MITNQTKIYIVTYGDYDDYRIIGVYSDLELAKARIQKDKKNYGKEGMEIEIYKLNSETKIGKLSAKQILSQQYK